MHCIIRGAFIIAAAHGASLFSPVFAQQQPAQNPPGTSGPSTPTVGERNRAGDITAEFLLAMASGDMFEIESGRIAEGKAQNSNLKLYAQRIVADHARLSAELKEKAAGAGLNPALPKLEAEAMSQLQALRRADGRDFDQLFIDIQRQRHAVALSALDTYVRAGDVLVLIEWSRAAKPVIEEHMRALEAAAR